MMVHVPKVLIPDQVSKCRDVMLRAAWVELTGIYHNLLRQWTEL